MGKGDEIIRFAFGRHPIGRCLDRGGTDVFLVRKECIVMKQHPVEAAAATQIVIDLIDDLPRSGVVWRKPVIA